MNTKNNTILNKNENLNSNDLLCPECASKLIFKHINLKNKMLFCSNKNCLFPMNSADMDNFIFNGNQTDLDEFFSNIKKIVFQQTLTNESNFEDKVKKINKDTLQNLDYSDILSNTDKNNFLDFLSENEDIKL